MLDDGTPYHRHVTALGGGHGLSASLSALRRLPVEITAVVTVADDGGSSGRLRSEFGVLPPGDLRMALAALCGDDEWGETWAEVLQHRFAGTGEMRGHVTGNLLIVSLWELLGDHVSALDWVGRLLGARGRVLPMALTPARHHCPGQRPVPRRPRAAQHPPRPGGRGLLGGHDRGDLAAPRRPACLPRGRPGRPHRRPGRARSRVVVHLRPAPPDGARAPRRTRSRPTAIWSSC